MTGTAEAGKPICIVASTTGGICSSLVTESTSRNSVTRTVSVQPAMRAARPTGTAVAGTVGWATTVICPVPGQVVL